MNPLFILAAVGIGGYLLLSKSSTATSATAAQLAQNQALIAANQNLGTAPTSGYGSPGTSSLDTPPDSGPPVAANGTSPGSVATVTAQGPMFHTGFSCARTGAPIVTPSRNGGGNPYLMFT